METNHKLTTSKEFNQPAEQVYAAWTEPEQLKQWWKPMNAELKEVINELNTGGKLEYRFTDSELQEFSVDGEYVEVLPNKRLAYSWNWHIPEGEEESYKLTVNFIRTESGSRIEVLQENFSNEAHLEPHEKGWEQGLRDLADHLNANIMKRPAGTINDHIPIVGYGSQE